MVYDMRYEMIYVLCKYMNISVLIINKFDTKNKANIHTY
jgi:septum formation topological specificity factor MinE